MPATLPSPTPTLAQQVSTHRPPNLHHRPYPQAIDRFAAMCDLIAKNPGLSGAAAYIAINGPQGAWPMKRFLPPPHGRGDLLTYPRAASLFARLAAEFRPDTMLAAQAAAERVLSNSAVEAATTVSRLARGDFAGFESEGATDPAIARVALQASQATLAACGISTRSQGSTSAQVGVTVQGQGAQQTITVFAALKQLGSRAESEQVRAPRRPRRVPLTATTLPSEPAGEPTSPTKPQGAGEPAAGLGA